MIYLIGKNKRLSMFIFSDINFKRINLIIQFVRFKFQPFLLFFNKFVIHKTDLIVFQLIF